MANSVIGPRAADIERLRWLVGIPRDFWIQHRDFIGGFIKEHNIPPVDVDHLAGAPAQRLSAEGGESEEAALRFFKPPPFPGGLRIPHLHFRGKLYQLDSDQWAAFSKTVVEQFQGKLASAGAVDFDKVIELSDAIDTIGY